MTSRRFLARTFGAICLLAAAAGASGAELKQGDAPPDYVGKTLGGDPVLLSQHADKAVVISFWATWCKYCLKELPILDGIGKLGKGRVAVIAINTEDRDMFRKVQRTLKDNVNMQLAYDPDRKAQAAFGVNGIPHMVIIGRDGKIAGVFRGYGEESLDAIVDTINRAAGAVQKAASPPGRGADAVGQDVR
jgi:thiol-disulfide isomerase/thioredoxin